MNLYKEAVCTGGYRRSGKMPHELSLTTRTIAGAARELDTVGGIKYNRNTKTFHHCN